MSAVKYLEEDKKKQFSYYAWIMEFFSVNIKLISSFEVGENLTKIPAHLLHQKIVREIITPDLN